MSSIPTFPSASAQNTDITTANNSSIIYTFLMGSYSTIYLGTLYLYLTSKAPQRIIVISAITSLFVVGLFQFAVQWFLIQYDANQTLSGAETAFTALFDYPTWSHIAIDATSFAMFVIADGLLIWRCYHAWGHSYRIILLPLFLLLVEVGLSLSSIIFILAVHSDPDTAQINVINDLQAGVFFVSFATSLATTVLIAHRIYASTQDISDASFSTSKRRFAHVVEIIVQSAAIYSIVLLISAISGVIPTGDGLPTPSVFALSYYSSCFLVPAAGIAPTIMVARVSLASSANNDRVASRSLSGALSHLQFGGPGRSTNYNEARIDLGVAVHGYGVHNDWYEDKNSFNA